MKENSEEDPNYKLLRKRVNNSLKPELPDRWGD